MKRSLLMLTTILVLALPLAAAADTFVDDFEGGTNHGGWYYNGNEILESEGGNPGWWLHNPEVMNFAVIFKSEWYADEFTGNYREMGVTQFDFDARLLGYSIPIEMSILLRDTNGTPGDVDDDDYAYYPGDLIPEGDGTWTHYEFAIPSDDTSDVPDGWFGGWVGDAENFRPGVTWNDVITSVDRVEIWYWHPAYFGIFAIWDAGLDNVAITSFLTTANESSSWSSVKSLY
jgi:hypothetical protein